MEQNTDSRVVLVTGAAGGFGRLTVEALARRGHTVFATFRDIDGRNRSAAEELTALARDEKAGLHVLELDVTDQAAAERVVATAIETSGRIDVVVNNAGVVFAGPLEAYSAEEAARQFDLNVLGALRLNRAVTPHMRRAGGGLLLQISSTGDRVTTPFTGLYCASKAALAALTEAWRHELRDSGIESVSVEAAPHATELEKHGVMPQDLALMAPYLPALEAFMADFQRRAAEHDLDPQPVADAVVALAEAAPGTRPHRTVVGSRVHREAIEAVNAAATEAARSVATDMGIVKHFSW